MNVFFCVRRATGPILLALALCSAARATDILNVTSTLTLADPIQLGRLSRNGIQQDWAGTELFPGIINPTVAYHYRTYVVDPAVVALGPYIQISIDSGADLFAAAYYTAYSPNSVAGGFLGFDTRWLGDAGVSGNAFGVDPTFFQVTVPVGSGLVVVVHNTAAANVGVGAPFSLLVESFSDTDYSPARAGAVPESGNAVVLLAFGLGCVVISRRFTKKSGAAANV